MINKVIFENQSFNSKLVFPRVVSYFKGFNNKPKIKNSIMVRFPTISLLFPVGFSDGAT